MTFRSIQRKKRYWFLQILPLMELEGWVRWAATHTLFSGGEYTVWNCPKCTAYSGKDRGGTSLLNMWSNLANIFHWSWRTLSLFFLPLTSAKSNGPVPLQADTGWHHPKSLPFFKGLKLVVGRTRASFTFFSFDLTLWPVWSYTSGFWHHTFA